MMKLDRPIVFQPGAARFAVANPRTLRKNSFPIHVLFTACHEGVFTYDEVRDFLERNFLAISRTG